MVTLLIQKLFCWQYSKGKGCQSNPDYPMKVEQQTQVSQEADEDGRGVDKIDDDEWGWWFWR